MIRIAMSPEQEQDHITIEEIISNAKEIMIRDGHHVPVLIMEADNKVVAGQIPDLPATHGERVQFMRFLGQVTAKSGRVDRLQQVFMVHEGWMSVASKDKPAEMVPSEDPDRKEVLIVSAIQVTERKKHVNVFEIRRDTYEQVLGIEEFLPAEKKNDELVEIPLLDAFVEGFEMAFRIRYN